VTKERHPGLKRQEEIRPRENERQSEYFFSDGKTPVSNKKSQKKQDENSAFFMKKISCKHIVIEV
jgi:hypothetical protein